MYSLKQLLSQAPLEGLTWQIQGSDEIELDSLAGLESAKSHQISFLSNPKFFPQLQTTQAGAVIMPERGVQALQALGLRLPFTVVVCEEPYLMFARLSQFFDQPRLASLHTGIHARAVIDPTAVLADDVSVGPNVVIEAGVRLDRGVIIQANTFIGKNTHIGEGTLIYPNVTIYHDVSIGQRCIVHAGVVIGADGFGNAPDATREKGAWSKIAQLGSVRIGNDVEIGANTTVDRGTLDDTIIKDGVRIDNLVMIAHNVHVGKHTAIAGCAAVAGSTHIGDRNILAGAVMMSGHLHLADDVQISGATSVMSDISEPGRYTSVLPSMPHKQWQKTMPTLLQLPELRKRLRQLEKQNSPLK